MANPNGPRVDLLYPQDTQLAQLVKEHRDQKSGGSLRALQTYYESRYGPLPQGHNLWGGHLTPNDSLGSFLRDGAQMGMQTYTGAQIFSPGVPTTNSTSTANTPLPTRAPSTGSRFLDIIDRAEPYIDAFGRMAGGAADQRAEDRGAQAEYDIARVPVENAQALQFAQAKRQAEADRFRQIGGMDMLQNFKTPTDPRAQKFLGPNGQLPGGQINPDTMAMMRERSMKALESGSDVPTRQAMPNQPGGGPTGTDSFLRTLRLAGDGLGTLREAGLMGGGDGGRQTSVNAPADLSASIFRNQDDDAPWWSPLARRGN